MSETDGSKGMFGGFKDFLMRGNIIDLAVAVVIGAAFTKVVDAVVKGFINPLIGSLGSKDLESYTSCLGTCVYKNGQIVEGIGINWGSILSALITFVLTAAVVYFAMVRPMKRYMEKRGMDTSPAQTEVDLLTEIRDELVAARRDGGGAPIGS
ncbi:large conductance mechanosensitive channel protein MscL [Streptomyces sp. NPDC051940]|uniref:large conductance mechanosensitive channel protein MscL n=1 Tax=Streptomyces sp. NPDC051940 TaxID=3155675 RepID=UPI00341F6412